MTATFPRELHRAGYRTGLVGKAHFQNMGHGAGIIDFVRPDWPLRNAQGTEAGPWDGICWRTTTATAKATSSYPVTSMGSATSS